jgi:hypothetical protein
VAWNPNGTVGNAKAQYLSTNRIAYWIIFAKYSDETTLSYPLLESQIDKYIYHIPANVKELFMTRNVTKSIQALLISCRPRRLRARYMTSTNISRRQNNIKRTPTKTSNSNLASITRHKATDYHF